VTLRARPLIYEDLLFGTRIECELVAQPMERFSRRLARPEAAAKARLTDSLLPRDSSVKPACSNLLEVWAYAMLLVCMLEERAQHLPRRSLIRSDICSMMVAAVLSF
jgi:hypothetical protein